MTAEPHERAIVVLPSRGPNGRDASLRLSETLGLAEALDLEVASAEHVTLRTLHPGGYFGAGRISDLNEAVTALKAGVVIVDASLSPVQQRNLERALNAKVVDRTGLILEIFARRARTREGRTQVELARLEYERSRLVRTWTHLERQRGGLGKTGGPGETQIELDRRQIAARIDKLKAELDEVRRTRGLQRSARSRAGLPSVALVGYTNAGKSSLFNRLTDAGVLAKDMPFATLDPTARLVRLPSGRGVIVADTVGFISDLPVELVAAFRATLEAVTEADLVVHVRDIAHPQTDAQREDVLEVLDQVAEGQSLRLIEAWNKVDLLDDDRRAARLRRSDLGAENAGPIAISAKTGEGVAALLSRIDELAYGPTQTVVLALSPEDGRTRAQIAAHGRIVDEQMAQDGRLHVTAELPAADAARFAGLAPQRHAAE